MTKARRWAASMVLAAGFGGALLAPARAGDIDAATQAAMQSVISQQIDAFGRGDAATAQSFAAPGIKQMFPDAEGFVDMVRRAYPPLIKPRSTHFETAGTTPLGPLQKVTIVDSAGVAWTAVYTFEQVDGQWRITGCVLVKEDSTTV